MKTNNYRFGFSMIGVIIIIALVSIMTLLSYLYYNSLQTAIKTNNSNMVVDQNPVSNDVTLAPEIMTVSDLTAAIDYLNNTTVKNVNDEFLLDGHLSAF